MRLFVSVPVPFDLSTVAEPARRVQGFREVAAGTWHLTLAFISNGDPMAVATALDGLRPELGSARCTVAGAFPSPQKANVLWLGVQAAGLEELAREVRERLAPYGIDTKPFRAHVTLGRFAKPTDARMLLRHVRVPSESFGFEAVHLMESALTRDGPEYRTAARYENEA